MFTNRSIYKPTRAKDRWAKHELKNITSAKNLTQKNENILEELAGLHEDDLKIIEEDANEGSEKKESPSNFKQKSEEQLNYEEQMNVHDHEGEEDEEEDEHEDMMEHPNALHVTKPLDGVQDSPQKNIKSPLNFDAISPFEGKDKKSEGQNSKSFFNTIRSQQKLD